MRCAVTFFALQRKSDGVIMPDYPGRAGGTYVDPDDPRTHRGTPRLFGTSTAAANALRWWAAGRVRVEYSGSGNPFDVFGEDVEITGLKSDSVAGRNADDWEIVPVEVRVIR